MAFGKDNNNLRNVGSFRSTAKQYQASRPKPSGGGGGGYFNNRFAPSMDDTDCIRVLRGTYEVPVGQQDGSIITQILPYWPYHEHFHATMKKGGICSAGPLGMFKGKGDPCLGCEIFWADKNAGRKNGPMSRRELWAFTVLHYAPYAKVPQTDKETGRPKVNEQTGQPYFNWQRVQPHERHKFSGFEMRDYNIMHWSIGSAHSSSLLNYDKEVGKSCASCGGMGTIQCEAWLCEHCGEALIDPFTTTLSPKEIEKLTIEPVMCASCQQKGMLQEIISCSQCSTAKRAEIFDVDINLKRVLTSEGGNQTQLMFVSSSPPRLIDQRYIEVAKPLDFAKIFSPTPYEKQQEMWGSTGGRATVNSGQLSREYNRTPTLGGNKPQY